MKTVWKRKNGIDKRNIRIEVNQWKCCLKDLYINDNLKRVIWKYYFWAVKGLLKWIKLVKVWFWLKCKGSWVSLNAIQKRPNQIIRVRNIKQSFRIWKIKYRRKFEVTLILANRPD